MKPIIYILIYNTQDKTGRRVRAQRVVQGRFPDAEVRACTGEDPYFDKMEVEASAVGFGPAKIDQAVSEIAKFLVEKELA